MSVNTVIKPATLAQETSILHVSNHNSADTVDIGFLGKYNDGADKHAGIVRDASDAGIFKFLNDITGFSLGTETVTGTDASIQCSTINATSTSASEIGNVTITDTTISSSSGPLTITSTANGDITFTPDGTGQVLLPATGASDSSAATKAYVDSVATGLDIKGAVRVKTDVALPAYTKAGTGVGATLTATATGALPTVDGITLVVSDRVLVTEGASAVDNGIYDVTVVGDGSNAWVLTRATDFDEDSEVSGGAFTFVQEGTVAADTGYVVSTDGTIIVDTTGITWTQFSAAGVITVTNVLGGDGQSLVTGSAPNYQIKKIDVADGANTTNILETSNNADEVVLTIDQLKITGTGALNAGSITSGFGAIDIGASTIDTTGIITGGTLSTTGSLLSATTSVLTYTGATGANEIVFPTNLAEGLVLRDSSVDFLVLDSTTATPTVKVTQHLDTDKGVQFGVVTVADTAATADESAMMYVFSTTLTADRVLTLPDITAANAGRVYRVINKQNSAFKVTVTPDGTDFIDGLSVGVGVDLLDQYDHLELQNDGVDRWYTF